MSRQGHAQGQKPEGQKPEGQKPEGQKPKGQKSEGQKPEGRPEGPKGRTPPQIPRPLHTTPTQSVKKELKVIKLQINAMETQISLIPEIKQFMETQKLFMDRKEDHTKTQAQILKMERKLFDAERINRETREKLKAAIESNGELKEAVTSWQNKAESAKGEVDRLTEATYLQGQQIKALKNKIENTHQAKRSQGQSHPTKQGDSAWNPKVSPGKKSNTQGPFTNVESTPPTPAPVTEHTENVSKTRCTVEGLKMLRKCHQTRQHPTKHCQILRSSKCEAPIS